MILPGGSTVVLEAGTVSNVKSAYDGSRKTYGIFCSTGNMAFKGSGTLIAGSGDTTDIYSFAVVAMAGCISFTDCTVNATAGSALDLSVGIVSGGTSISIASGTVNAYGGYAPQYVSAGIYCEGSSQIIADLNISGGTVNAVGGRGSRSFGIYNYYANITVTGGTLTATAAAISSDDVNGAASVSESISGSLAGGGYEPAASRANRGVALYGACNITATGGTVKFSGEQAAYMQSGVFSLGAKTWYKWRTSKDGRYTDSWDTAYTHSDNETYIEVTSSIPPTGDTATPALWAALAAFAAAGLALVFGGSRRRAGR